MIYVLFAEVEVLSHTLVYSHKKQSKISCCPETSRVYFADNQLPGSLLVSATDLGCEGRWEWCGGGRLADDLWMENQPDNFRGEEHCAEALSYNSMKLNDINCEEMRYFICQLM